MNNFTIAHDIDAHGDDRWMVMEVTCELDKDGKTQWCPACAKLQKIENAVATFYTREALLDYLHGVLRKVR